MMETLMMDAMARTESRDAMEAPARGRQGPSLELRRDSVGTLRLLSS
jgi:hypothetical protein